MASGIIQVTPDSGWLFLTSSYCWNGTGLYYRKIGNVVYMKNHDSFSLTSQLSQYEMRILFALPEGYRPSSQIGFAGTCTTGKNIRCIGFTVGTAGSVSICNNGGDSLMAQQPVKLSASWIAEQ